MMKNLVLVLCSILIMLGCTKEPSEMNVSQNEYSDISTRSRDLPRDIESHTQTILGGVKNNPYELSNMQAAYKSLVPYWQEMGRSPNINVTTTHKLLKFEATTAESFKKLMTDDNLILFDYPLNYEVVEMGDFYYSSNSTTDFPAMWAIVDVGTSIPSIPYSVVEEYAYIFSHPVVVAESFRLTGHSNFTNDYISGEEWDNEDPEAIPGPNQRPDCGPGWEAYVTNPHDHPDLWVWACRKINTVTQDNNACGCPIPWNPREPAGCVNVENDVDEEGVSRVKVLIADNWGQFLSPIERFTDENGCWRTHKNYSKNVWVWVRFQNEFSYERSHRNWGHVNEFLAPIRNYVGKFGEPHNNIHRHYPKWTQQDSKAQIYWGAATVNNQVQVFRDWVAAQPGVAQVPKLDIYLVDDRGAGACLMSGHRSSGFLATTIAPDVTIGLFRGANATRREDMDELSYHEFAHASHFMQVGQGWYNTLINQELVNAIQWDQPRNLFGGEPWGQGNEPNAGHVALAESWADNIMTDIMNVPQENVVLENGYIPMGLYEDLADDMVDPVWRVRDNVMGYTTEQMSNGMNANVTTVAEYRDFLSPLLPAGNTQQALTDLFDDYQ